MEVFRSAVRGLSKAVGSLAGVVALFAPITGTGIWVMVVSVTVGLVCFAAYMWSEPGDDEPDGVNEPN